MQTTAEVLNISKARNYRLISIAAISDLFLYVFSFFIFLFIKNNSPYELNSFSNFIPCLLFAWAFSALITKKLLRLSYRTYLENVRAFFLSFFIFIGSLSLFINLQIINDISRFVLFGSLLFSFSIELIFLWFISPSLEHNKKRIKLIKSKEFFFIELIILTLFLFLFIIFYLGLFNLYDDIILLLAGIYLIWFISSVFVHRYKLDFSQNYWQYIGSFVKSYFIFTSLLLFLLFIFQIDFNIKINLAGYSLIYPILSFFIFSQLYFVNIPKKTDLARIILLDNSRVSDNLINIEKVSKINYYEPENIIDKEYTFSSKLKEIYLSKFPQLFNFINSKINLNKINLKNSIVLHTTEVYNVEVLPDNCLEIFINLHELNDIRRINSYLSEVNNKLIKNGIFIGRIESIKFRYRKFISKYPFYIGLILFLFDFVWTSMIPKIPVIKKIFFAISKGRKRTISIAEGIGRLYYTGFKLISGFELDNYFYFIAQKETDPFKDNNPSYGILFKMRREGKEGKEIFVYKLRTMHPYSEYIQKFVYDINNLEIGGKIKNDFRVTSWGRLLRRLWIDELPMIINLLKGDLKLVGVRPLSNHYLSLYTEELREKRRKFKPGLLPPFYADMPRTLQDIMDSENRYLDAYNKNPVLTDVKYLLMILKNILVNKERSA